VLWAQHLIQILQLRFAAALQGLHLGKLRSIHGPCAWLVLIVSLGETTSQPDAVSSNHLQSTN
jgi:hypothetical protein